MMILDGVSRLILVFASRLRALQARGLTFSWKLPSKAEVLIWDSVGSGWLLEVLGSPSVEILRVRNHPICLHPKIVAESILGMITRTDTHYGVIIRNVAPKIVITFIHNDLRFHRLSNQIPKVRFVAIQNGVLNPASTDRGLNIGAPANYNSEFLCWGQRDTDTLRTLGLSFKAVTAVGSLKDAVFISREKSTGGSTVGNPKLDVVLISQFRMELLLPNPEEVLREYEQIVTFLQNFLTSRDHVRIGIALITGTMDANHVEELRFHQRILGDLPLMVPGSEDGLASYRLTQGAEVVLSASSALGLESLGRGRKTLMTSGQFFETNLTTAGGANWWLGKPTQESFDAQLEALLSIGREDFVRANASSSSYFIRSNNPEPLAEIFKTIWGHPQQKNPDQNH